MSVIDVYEAPDERWAANDVLGRLAFDALACEERNRAGTSLPKDEGRYARIVRQIMDQAQVSPPRTSFDGEAYIGLVEDARTRAAATPGVGERARSRGMAVFFRPDDLAAHVELLRRCAEADEARRVVTTLAACRGGAVLIPRIGARAVEGDGPAEVAQLSLPDAGGTVGWPSQPYEALVRQFEVAPERGIVNVGPFSNEQLAAAIHVFAFGEDPPKGYRLRFDDGSLSEPLVLPMVSPAAVPEITSPRLRFALLSHRHLDLDQQVDMNWFRNAETSTGDAHAVIEQRCADVTRRQLTAYTGERLRIEMDQTGLLPAVVGFYRGVLETLKLRRGRFEVTVDVLGRRLSWR